MIHGLISGYFKSPLTVFEKKRGKFDSKVYCKEALPSVHTFIKATEQKVGSVRAMLMDNNASEHTSRFIRAWHAYDGFDKMEWPANSPGLNSIETVWRYRVEKRFPKTEIEVRQYINEEWDKLIIEDFVKYIREMLTRYKTVIEANGGHTSGNSIN